MEPLLSIVIPTRNRQKYCIKVIEDILSYQYSNLELCIQDNSDDDEIQEYISNLKVDSRLIYKRISHPIASILNIGGSLGMATGKYVILLGDDDTILPSIFSAVEYMNENDIDSLCPIPIINYYWPNAHPVHSDGYLTVPKQKFEYNEVKDVDSRLLEMFRKGTTRYLLYYLPKVYHGIVKREILEKIKNTVGYYAGGVSPDIYLSVSISSLVNNHYTSNFAVSIAGACSKSTTSESINNGHKGDLKDAPHFQLLKDYQWDSRVPNYYSVDTIWAESALKAVKEMNIPKLDEVYNFDYLAAYSLLHNRSIFKFAFAHTYNRFNNIQYFKKIFLLGLLSAKVATKYFNTQIKKKIFKDRLMLNKSGLSNISLASKEVVNLMSDT